MIFTAASFTISTVATLISAIGFITGSKDKDPRLVRLGWIFLFVIVAAYLVGVISLLSPNSVAATILPPDDSNVPIMLLVAVGIVGTVVSAYLAFKRTRPVRAAGAGTWQYPGWRPWALIALVIVPLLTIVGAGYHYFG